MPNQKDLMYGGKKSLNKIYNEGIIYENLAFRDKID